MGAPKLASAEALLVNSAEKDETVRDEYHLAYIVMYMLGFGSLLPWNALVTPVNYWRVRLDGSEFEDSFEAIQTSTITFSSLVTILALQPLQNTFSLRTLIIFALTLLLLIFALQGSMAVLALGLPDSELIGSLSHAARSQFIALVVCGSLAGVGEAAITSAAATYASLFGQPQYIQAISGGQGLAGLAVTLGSLLVSLPGITRTCARPEVGAAPLAAETPTAARDVVGAGAVYFWVSVGVLAVCLLGFWVVERLPFTRARKRIAQRHREAAIAGLDDGLGGLGGGTDAEANFGSPASRAPPASSAAPSGVHGGAAAEQHVAEGMCRRSESESSLPLTSSSQRLPLAAMLSRDFSASCADRPQPDGSRARLLRSVWRWAASIVLIYVVTIAIFPSLTAALTATPGASCEWSRLFGPLLFVVYNLGDTIGRNLPCPVSGGRRVLLLTASRVLFAPAFMMCHSQTATAVLPGVFDGSDAAPLALMLVFAITNGWLTTSVFISSMEDVEPHQRGPATSLLVVFLNVGIFTGAALSLYLPCTFPVPSLYLSCTFLNVGIFTGAALSFLVIYLACTPSATDDCNPFINPSNGTDPAAVESVAWGGAAAALRWRGW